MLASTGSVQDSAIPASLPDLKVQLRCNEIDSGISRSNWKKGTNMWAVLVFTFFAFYTLGLASPGTDVVDLKTKLSQDRKGKCCVCFAIDDSGSIDAGEFSLQVNLVKLTTLWNNVFRPNSCYSACAFTSVQFEIAEETSNIPDFFNELMAYTRTPGGTQLFEGLDCCRDQFNLRRCTSKSIVLISDGAQSSTSDTTTTGLANSLKLKDGISIVTVGISPTPPDTAFLTSIASNPKCFFRSNFNALRRLQFLRSNAVSPFRKKKTKLARNIASKLCPPPNKPPCCVCYALDQSGSISQKEWNSLRSFVGSVSNLQNSINPNTVYSSCIFNTAAGLGSKCTSDVSDLISGIPVSPAGGGTFIGSGLQCCKRLLSTKKCSKQTIVLISDGLEPNEAGTLAIANSIKGMGVSIISVQVGTPSDPDHLEDIASNPQCVIKTTFPRLIKFSKKKKPSKEAKRVQQKLCR